MTDNEFTIRQEITALQFEIKKLREERQVDQIELDRIKALNNKKQIVNDGQDQRIRLIDQDVNNLSLKAGELKRIADIREQDL